MQTFRAWFWKSYFWFKLFVVIVVIIATWLGLSSFGTPFFPPEIVPHGPPHLPPPPKNPDIS